VWLAGFLAARAAAAEMADVRKTFKPIGIAFLIIAVVVAAPAHIIGELGGQSDLGSLGVITAIIGAMCFVAGLPMKRILLGLLAIILVGTIAIVSTPYRRARLTSFMNPSSNCLTAGGYQQCQALIAVGSGGMVGLGLGNSVQAYGYLPEAGNDSIFAIYAEKFGFVGCAVLLGLFLALFGRIKRIAERAPDNFSRLLVIGIFAWFSTQVVVNIGAMVGLLPLKGITLPLISQGGSSVIIVLGALGLIFQISRYTVHRLPETMSSNRGDTQHDNRRDGRRVRGAYNPTFGRRT
jgi:cell division protein FtsW